MAESTKSNSGTYLLIGILIGLVVVYFIFMDKINKFISGLFNKSGATSSFQYSCKGTFYAKLDNGKYLNVTTADIGNTGAPVIKYYKRYVTFNESGVTNDGDQLEITKSEFEGLCKYKYEPPYAWYTEKPSTGGSEGHGRTR